MGLYAKTILFARRLWVFYLLIGIFSAFFGVFYYRYLPGNEAELDTRGFRILDQLTNNMTARNTTLAGSFRNVVCDGCGLSSQTAIMHLLYQNIHFGIADPPQKMTSGLQHDAAYGWSMVYPIGVDSPQKKTTWAVVRINDFIEPVLAARTDLFDSYILLARDSSKNAQFKVVYLQSSLSSSYGLSADSALSLQKNSDLADITTVSIGGEAYNLFFQPFEFSGSRLVLGGLIRKAEYDRQIKSLPPHFVVGMILVILLGLVVLPFIKVYFISPRETINKPDVIRIMMALYLGTAILIMAGIYFLADYSAHFVAQDHLQLISDKLEADIRHDLDAAGHQLKDYVDDYQNLGNLTPSLAYKDTAQTAVDKIFAPATYPLSVRIIWFDSLGNTIAKWNPYTYISPPSPVKGYPFFSQLQQKNPDDTSLVLSAGQSNITSEFQMFLARRLQQRIDTSMSGNGKNLLTSFGILMPFYLHCDLHPVLPRGYGFCLVDNRSLGVLLHSDSRRNLSENLFQETGGNERLKNVIDHKLKTWIDGVDLYGTSHSFYCRPIAGQQVSLVVFYDDTTHSENIFRMIHFGAETLLYLAILFIICLLMSTAEINSPPKISFKIDPVEWVRPRSRNTRSYRCTRRYFLDLIGISLLLFIVMITTHLDIRIALYPCLLLPFYALWGFIAGRRKENPRFPPDTQIPLCEPGSAAAAPDATALPAASWWKIYRRSLPDLFLSAKVMTTTLVLLNLFIFAIMTQWQLDQGPEVAIFTTLFQVLVLISLTGRYCQYFYLHKYQEENPGYLRAYIHSVYLSVLVITVIPALGFLWYGWSVEKIQFLRSDQLSIMIANEEHLRHASHLIHELKPDVVRQLDDKNALFTGPLLYKDSRYLAVNTISTLQTGWPEKTNWRSKHDPDQPYITLLDELFVITAGEYDSYSVGIRAADSSWFFLSDIPGSIDLVRPFSQDYPPRKGAAADPLFRDFRISAPLKDSLFSLAGTGLFHDILMTLAVILFLLGLPQLLLYTAQRVFLLGFPGPKKPKEQSLLIKYFPEGRFPQPDFLGPRDDRRPLEEQEEHILDTMAAYRTEFQKIWEELTSQERYFVYGFSSDGYANYRDFKVIYSLLKKGVLDRRDDKYVLFAISFREFVAQKKGTAEIARLKTRYTIPGVWATIRIPALIVITACAFLLVFTQESVSHKVTVMVTSAGAIIPVILEITKKFTSKGAS